MISHDMEGRILRWNRGAAALFGYTAEEALGQPIGMLIPPEAAEEAARLLALVRDGQRIRELETVRFRKNGTRIHVSLSISPIRLEHGIAGASLVARDISERKRLEAANAQLAAIVEYSEDAIISKDLEGTIQTWNASAERVYGYTAAEAIGRNIRFLVPEGSEQEETQILSQIARGERVAHFETLRVRKGGRSIYVSLSVSPIRNRAGVVVGASHVARDVTERRRLEAGNAQLAAIVANSEDAIISKDLNGVVQTWNEGAQRIYGYSAEEAIGRAADFLLPPHRASEEREILASLRRGEPVAHFETTRLRKDGELIDVSLSISPIRNGAGTIAGVSHVARDITERKKFEEKMRQTQRLESLGVLAGGIAHDFNNLLTGIIGNASLLAEVQSPEGPARGYVADLLAAAERAADLTRQLLAYSGKGQLVISAVHLSDTVAEIATLVKASIPKTATLYLDLEKDLPLVRGDATQIQQLIMNLIINGAEAIGENRPGTVLVRTGSRELDEGYLRSTFPSQEMAPGEYAFVEVHDNGSGMDEQTRSRIFEPFFTTKFAGRGLGLAAAIGIAQAHDGAISVYSTPGQGSTFTIFLPAIQDVSSATRKPAVKGTVLVVDDEEIVRKVAKASLESYGYEVLLAADGREALDLFREQAKSIALVVLDLTMPVMAGKETLQHLLAIRNVPVILSSGYNEVEARQRFECERVAGFVHKPYTSRELRAKVDAAVAPPDFLP